VRGSVDSLDSDPVSGAQWCADELECHLRSSHEDSGSGQGRHIWPLAGSKSLPGFAISQDRARAISLQATIFVTASAALGRPRTDVPHLDPAPPTSSYPSGHVGACVAL